MKGGAYSHHLFIKQSSISSPSLLKPLDCRSFFLLALVSFKMPTQCLGWPQKNMKRNTQMHIGALSEQEEGEETDQNRRFLMGGGRDREGSLGIYARDQE